MAFMDGHPLPSTVLRCQYLRPEMLMRAFGTPPPRQGASPNTVARHAVLRALLLSNIKFCEIVYEELCRMNVYEVRRLEHLTKPRR